MKKIKHTKITQRKIELRIYWSPLALKIVSTSSAYAKKCTGVKVQKFTVFRSAGILSWCGKHIEILSPTHAQKNFRVPRFVFGEKIDITGVQQLLLKISSSLFNFSDGVSNCLFLLVCHCQVSWIHVIYFWLHFLDNRLSILIILYLYIKLVLGVSALL